ncbi:MAG: hypothetical protein DHS20C13_11220 [Thermodesulfobacteriota bacterium]|nr:MAG: hypothetical protein DHS20C13_11220 [Thermodesulfobacteriota bacterium]
MEEEKKTKLTFEDSKSEYKPEYEQELLLSACLLKGEAAIDAYNQWKTSVDLDNVDPGSYRLFPLLYFNLNSQGIEDPMMNIFKWVYTKTAENNQILVKNLAQLLKEFNKSSLETILLKGTALITTCYKDYGLRPMMDADLLVPTEKAGEAIQLLSRLGWNSSITPLKGFQEMALLSRLGWTPGNRKLEDFTDEYFCVRHGQDFTNPEKFTVDLHWHVLQGYNASDADVDFWQGARSISVEGVNTLVLDPADLLLHVCSHGAKWDTISPIRWVADATWIIDSTNGEIDWNRFIEVSNRHGNVLHAKEALRYLNRYLECKVPKSVFEVLDAAHITKAQYLGYHIRMRPPGILDGFYELSFLYSNYSRTNQDKNFFRRIAGYPRFLQNVLGMEKLRHLVLYSVFEFVRRGLELPGSIIRRLR